MSNRFAALGGGAEPSAAGSRSLKKKQRAAEHRCAGGVPAPAHGSGSGVGAGSPPRHAVAAAFHALKTALCSAARATTAEATAAIMPMNPALPRWLSNRASPRPAALSATRLFRCSHWLGTGASVRCPSSGRSSCKGSSGSSSTRWPCRPTTCWCAAELPRAGQGRAGCLPRPP